MKTAEILRNIISLLDVEEQPAQQQPIVINVNNGDNTPEAPAEEPKAEPSLADRLGLIDPNDKEEKENIPDNTGVMVPPLQQKIELMKKAQGIDNVYDEAAEETDELDIIKKNAGLSPTAVFDADEDEPLEG